MFLKTLHLVLSYSDTQHIISWLPDGTTWKIHDPLLFVDWVMPKYFGELLNNLESFALLLNGWGFQRIQHGENLNGENEGIFYYHELFQRDSLTGLDRMTYRKNDVDPVIQNTQMHDDEPVNQNPTDSPLKITTFPYTLYLILSNPEHHGIINWVSHGLGWKILNQALFVSQIMPRYFTQQTTFSSFTRQISGWGFKRIRRNEDLFGNKYKIPRHNGGQTDVGPFYFHILFRRDHPDMIDKMKRLTIQRPVQQMDHQGFIVAASYMQSMQHCQTSFRITEPSNIITQSNSIPLQASESHRLTCTTNPTDAIMTAGNELTSASLQRKAVYPVSSIKMFGVARNNDASPNDPFELARTPGNFVRQGNHVNPSWPFQRNWTDPTRPDTHHVHGVNAARIHHTTVGDAMRPYPLFPPPFHHASRYPSYNIARSIIEEEEVQRHPVERSCPLPPSYLRHSSFPQRNNFIGNSMIQFDDVQEVTHNIADGLTPQGSCPTDSNGVINTDATPDTPTSTSEIIIRSLEQSASPSEWNIDNDFPRQLRMVLSIPEYQSIISWMPHGNAWKIHNQELFEKTVMPICFPGFATLDSFIGQVRRLGFKLVQGGIDQGAYYNELFFL